MEKKNNDNPQKKNRKILKIVAISLSIILSFVCGYFSRYLFEPKQVNVSGDLVRIIENFGYFVDENGEVKEFSDSDYAKVLTDGLLDEYSRYYSEEEYQKLKDERKGNTSGFGISISSSEKLPPKILSIIGNSPADIAGLRADDLVISGIKEEKQSDFSSSKDLSEFLFSCEKGDKITLNILRGEDKSPISYSIIKSQYKISYVEYYDSEHKMSFRYDENENKFIFHSDEEQKISQLNNDVALIKLSQFEGEVAEQFQSALLYMKEKGKEKLILDLRGNGGGYMDVLCEVSASLIKNGGKRTLIAHSKSKSGEQNFYMDKSKNNNFIKSISILANEGSASATECLIGAMLFYQENFSLDRLVVEKNQEGIAKTFGKGIMQTTFLMTGGGAFRLTTAQIYWPDKSTSIHKKGIFALEENATSKGKDAVFRANELLNN